MIANWDLLILILSHIAGFIWWAAAVSTRIGHIEKWVESNEQNQQRLSSLESSVRGLQQSMNRIEGFLLKDKQSD